MREPRFWYRPRSLASLALDPLARLYGAIAARRLGQAGHRAAVPVICVGNYQLGGSGKTPTVLLLAAELRQLGQQPFVLSRGYGGRLEGPVRVDPSHHTAADVGDEPLMMAGSLPAIVARDRVRGAALAVAEGAGVILMDDGFQNPSLAKTASLIVVDATRGIGNGRVFPAGPLRAPLAPQIARTDALMLIGDGSAAAQIERQAAGRPLFRGHLVPDARAIAALKGARVLAFAGIGHPAKFFRTLEAAGIEVAATRNYPDHHVYSAADLAALRRQAAAGALRLVTTRKDAVRIGDAPDIAAFDVSLQVENREALGGWLARQVGG